MKNAKWLSAVSMGLLMAAGSAYAHDDAYLDTLKAPHGGQVRMAGMYHFELVVSKDSKEVKDNPLLVYVTDHAGQKIAMAGATGTATLLVGKSKLVATLVPDGDNRLKGSASYASAPDLKAILSVTPAGKASEQARFTPLAAAKDEHTEHKH